MAETTKIAVLDDYADEALTLADWSSVGDVTVYNDTISGRDALIERLRPYEILCVMRERTPLPAQIINALPNLKLIVTSGTRNLSIDVAAATARDVIVCGTDLRTTTTPELTMGLILALERRIVAEARSLHAGGWQSRLGRDLHGLTLGLVGLGKVGQQVAVLAHAFGMNVVAWSQNLTSESCEKHGVTLADSLTDLMQVSDIVSIHLVLSDRSRGLIDAQALSALRPGATLINTSRAPIVDNGALLEGLRTGKPASAAIDVFDEEPLPVGHQLRDDDLISSGRLLLTPHLGYASQQTFQMFYGRMVQDIEAWKAGAPIRVIQ